MNIKQMHQYLHKYLLLCLLFIGFTILEMSFLIKVTVKFLNPWVQLLSRKCLRILLDKVIWFIQSFHKESSRENLYFLKLVKAQNLIISQCFMFRPSPLPVCILCSKLTMAWYCYEGKWYSVIYHIW